MQPLKELTAPSGSNSKTFRFSPVDGLTGVFGEQGNSVNLAMGTREQSKKYIGKKGTRNIVGNKGTNPFFLERIQILKLLNIIM